MQLSRIGTIERITFTMRWRMTGISSPVSITAVRPAPKGRAWRKIIYGSVGVLSSKEQAEALRKLIAERPYIDGNRVWCLGLERRRNQYSEPDVSLAGSLQSRRSGCARA